MSIHPTAVVSESASLGANVTVGPYCVIGDGVTIGDNTVLHSHVAVYGNTTIGSNCQIFPFASLGHAPQDLKFKGEKSSLTIGDNNVIREHVTMNPGTEGGTMVTRVGSNCLFMVGAHVAHDCQVGDHVILANNATLAGHVEVGDHTIIGGMSAIHQFVRIGKHAIIGGMSGVENDVIPFGSVVGERASLAGLNLVGLKRRGFERDTIHALRNVYKALFENSQGTLAERCTNAREAFAKNNEVMQLLTFLENKGSRAVCMPKSRADNPQAA